MSQANAESSRLSVAPILEDEPDGPPRKLQRMLAPSDKSTVAQQVERFISLNTTLDEHARSELRKLSPLEAQAVLSQGELQNENPSKIILERIRVAVDTKEQAVLEERKSAQAALDKVRQGFEQVGKGKGKSTLAGLALVPEVEEFIKENDFDDKVASYLRSVEWEVQKEVVMQGNIRNCRNPSAVCFARIRESKRGQTERDAEEKAAKAAATPSQSSTAAVAAMPTMAPMMVPMNPMMMVAQAQQQQMALMMGGMGGMGPMGMNGMCGMGGMGCMGGMCGMGNMSAMGSMCNMNTMGGAAPIGAMGTMGNVPIMSAMGGMVGMGGMVPLPGMSCIPGMSSFPMLGMGGVGNVPINACASGASGFNCIANHTAAATDVVAGLSSSTVFADEIKPT